MSTLVSTDNLIYLPHHSPKKEDPLYVIYALRVKGSNNIRYIGQTHKGIQHRLNVHVRESRYRETAVYRWIQKHGENIEAILLEVGHSDSVKKLDSAEIWWIYFLRRSGCDLLNHQSGGRNTYPIDTKKASHTGVNHYNYGRKHSTETRKKLSEARKKRITSEETKQKMRDTWAKRGPATAKLTADDVFDIKNRLLNGDSLSTIAKIYGVTKANISSIKRGKTWKHIIVLERENNDEAA